MPDTLPRETRASLVSIEPPLTRAKADKLEHVIVVVPRKVSAATWKRVPAADALRRLERRLGRPDAVPSAHTRLGNRLQTGISLCRLAPEATPFRRLEVARKLIAHALSSNPASLGLLVTGFDAGVEREITEALMSAALAATVAMPSHKSKKPKPHRLKRVAAIGTSLPNLDRIQATHEGNYLARWLTSLPPNELDTARYRQRVTELATERGWAMSFLDRAALEQRKAGAFLAVARAGDLDAGIAHLRYRPGDADARPDLALIGKGICFDTGGVNVKPAQYMRHMHDDMQGSAVALGVLSALTQLGSPLAVDCWLAISENLIGREAYKPAEVVTASNGTTIEIVHTDAEGRMVLADTLAIATGTKPRVMIDYATLTGACVTALTERYSGVFSNRAALNQLAIEAGAASGERVWPFPMDDDFDDELRSDVADLRQCRINAAGDHILAARLLSRFAGRTPWLHIDLAAGRHEGGLAHIPTDVTGFGVRLTLAMLLEHDLLGHCA